MKKGRKEFDPDELVLSQNQILEFCDKVLTKWKGDPNQKRSNIVAMTAVRNSVYWSDEESLKAIWSEILKWTFELMYKNAIAQAKEENLEWSPILEKLEKKEKSISYETGIWY
ncbi:MAG: hypothetical protein QQN48_03385 [Nitrosopumilus sp.]|jgi:hypothetical protein|nr:hypothetical protein [Nitrososphaerota archaeon]